MNFQDSVNHYADFLARRQRREVTEDDLVTAYSLLNELRMDGRLLPASTTPKEIRDNLYEVLSPDFEINSQGYDDAALSIWNMVMLGERPEGSID